MIKRSRIKFLEKEEVFALIGTAPLGTIENALMHVLWSTGLRVSEALALPRKPFYAPPHETMQLSIVGKGGWQRLVFFSPECMAAVQCYIGDEVGTGESEDSRLFPITSRTAERIVDRAVEKAGFSGRKITPHTFRHSLATHLLRQGANIRIVQETLGHRAISSTMVYTGVANKDLLEAHKKFL